MNDSNSVSSLYPPPPPYIKFFTKENVDRASQARAAHRATDPEQITSELDFLVPPPIPSAGHYRAFGNIWQVKDELPDLETVGLRKLYDDSGKQDNNYQYKIKQLHKLLKSLLLNMLELIAILGVNPELFPQKVEHIRTILFNIHHLLNEYRPHQSRESLIMLLEEQLEHKKSEIQHIHATCDKVEAQLANLCKQYIE
ncbi:HBL304Cp [Eremothecium sinecaudum]|uniref:Mediator of RNA polymerase II transcription subunit 7 n=1 Tax=Eremothecium sinecaudum TaxID=45286 RepID=A0A109UW17_9SACH|nr:HBL304Cp [Eremothecium sinecaudum]AMD18598.1 HBL304Cp [Eremothecium sinecaudum]